MSNIEPKTTEVGGVKVAITPSEQIAKAAAKEVSVTDSLGRVIRLKKPMSLANLDFKKALGNNHQNIMYLVEVMPLAYVAAIDDVAVAVPTTDAEIRALYVRLGEEGNDAVQTAVSENFFTPPHEVEQAVKNS